MDEDDSSEVLGFWLLIVTILFIFCAAFGFIYKVQKTHQKECEQICDDAEPSLDHNKCYCAGDEGNLLLRKIF